MSVSSHFHRVKSSGVQGPHGASGIVMFPRYQSVYHTLRPVTAPTSAHLHPPLPTGGSAHVTGAAFQTAHGLTAINYAGGKGLISHDSCDKSKLVQQWKGVFPAAAATLGTDCSSPPHKGETRLNKLRLHP